MIKQCRGWGLPDPEFTDGPDFRIVIRRTGTNPPVNPPVNPLVNPPVKQTGNLGLTKNESFVLSQLMANGHLTYNDLSKMLGVHRDTVRVAIASLVKARLIIRVGSDKTGYWKVVKS